MTKIGKITYSLVIRGDRRTACLILVGASIHGVRGFLEPPPLWCNGSGPEGAFLNSSQTAMFTPLLAMLVAGSFPK